MAGITVNEVLSPSTIKVMEALEGCSIEEIIKKLAVVFQGSLPPNRPKETVSNPLEKYPIYLGAPEIPEILHICEAVAYQVMHHQECPTTYMGKRMVVQREAFWGFLMSHKGKRLW